VRERERGERETGERRSRHQQWEEEEREEIREERGVAVESEVTNKREGRKIVER